MKGTWNIVFQAFFIAGCITRIAYVSVYMNPDPMDSSSASSEGKSSSELVGEVEGKKHQHELKKDIGDILFVFPSYSFFVVYYIFLSCLAEIYFTTRKNENLERLTLYRKLHNSEDSFRLYPGSRTQNYRVMNLQAIVAIILNMSLFVIVTVIILLKKGDQKLLKNVPNIIFVVLYCAISVGYCVFGWLVFVQSHRIVKSLPQGNSNEEEELEIQSKKAKSRRILLQNSVITLLFMFIFVARTIVIIAKTSLIMADKYSEDLATWFIYFLYYTIFEAIPLTLTLYLFVILPGKGKAKEDDDTITAYY